MGKANRRWARREDHFQPHRTQNVQPDFQPRQSWLSHALHTRWQEIVTVCSLAMGLLAVTFQILFPTQAEYKDRQRGSGTHSKEDGAGNAGGIGNKGEDKPYCPFQELELDKDSCTEQGSKGKEYRQDLGHIVVHC